MSNLPSTSSTSTASTIQNSLVSEAEANLFHCLTILSESYRPLYLKLIIHSLHQSPFTIQEIERIYLEEIILLGWMTKQSMYDQSWRLERQKEILQMRLERKQAQVESSKSRIWSLTFLLQWIKTLKYVKFAFQWLDYIVTFGSIWKHDALDNWRVVKLELQRMEVSAYSLKR